MLTIDGLISGIDTDAIVAGLLDIQQQQIDLLEGRKAEIAAKQGAFQAIQAQLQTLRSSAGALARSQNSALVARVANVSDENAVLATASGSAATGVYDIRVNSLARAHQVASQGFADADSAITQGTITLQAGSAPPVTLTIDSTNDTLEGLAEAINNSDAGISASIIQDGSGSGASYRLLLTGKKTGASQQIAITNNLAASGGGATQPTFDLGNPVQAAADASITLGSGAGAITVQSASNTVNNLISGVSLTLRRADAGKDITISVEADTEPATTAVSDFVDTFNALVGRSVSVSVVSDRLVVTSDTYGSASQVTVGTGSANTPLGFSGTENEVGKDVAGTFIVDGVTESAVGKGQLLTGNSDNAHTADLQVRISLTPADVVPGTEADITITRGLAARLDQILNSFLDPVTGRFKTISEGFDETTESLQQRIDRQTAEFERQREKIIRDFTALESAISELNNTSSFIAAQLAGISQGNSFGSLAG